MRGPDRVYGEVGGWVPQTIHTFTDSFIYLFTHAYHLSTDSFIHWLID